MKKSTKGLIILILPFVLGFLIGILVGRGWNNGHRSSKADRTSVQVDSAGAGLAGARQDGCESGNGLGSGADTGSGQETGLDSEDDVDGTGDSKAVEVYYRSTLKQSYSRLFNDVNDEHLRVADSIGLRSIPKRADGLNLKGLIHISDCDWYVVDDLKYSVPYLTKGGAIELNNIGKAFSDSLTSKHLPDYKLVVTSILRTEEDVEKLRRSGNPNASDVSSHCYGTTFDITYTHFIAKDESKEYMQPYELTKVLAEVLRDEKARNRCIVKYERKEHCFHITSLHR